MKGKKQKVQVYPEDLEKSVAMEAAYLVRGEKRDMYGPVKASFQWVADLANVVLPGKGFSAADIAMLMICVKLARERFAHNRDNMVDICGYADLYSQILDQE